LLEEILIKKKELFLPLHKEAFELLNVFAVTKKKLKEKLSKNK